MDRDVLADKEVNKILTKKMVYVRINVDKKTDIAHLYGIRGYPSTWFLDPSGKRIVQIPGYVSKKEFKRILAFVNGGHYKNTTLHEFLKIPE